LIPSWNRRNQLLTICSINKSRTNVIFLVYNKKQAMIWLQGLLTTITIIVNMSIQIWNHLGLYTATNSTNSLWVNDLALQIQMFEYINYHNNSFIVATFILLILAHNYVMGVDPVIILMVEMGTDLVIMHGLSSICLCDKRPTNSFV